MYPNLVRVSPETTWTSPVGSGPTWTTMRQILDQQLPVLVRPGAAECDSGPTWTQMQQVLDQQLLFWSARVQQNAILIGPGVAYLPCRIAASPPGFLDHTLAVQRKPAMGPLSGLITGRWILLYGREIHTGTRCWDRLRDVRLLASMKNDPHQSSVDRSLHPLAPSPHSLRPPSHSIPANRSCAIAAASTRPTPAASSSNVS